MLRKLLLALTVLGVTVAVTGCGSDAPINTSASTTQNSGKPDSPPAPPPIPPPPGK